MMAQLRSVDMPPTAVSIRLFGQRDASAQVFGVTWHVVTAVFVVSAGALYLAAFDVIDSRELLRFISLLHVAFLAVGLIYVRKPLEMLRAPIPPIFLTAMVTAASGAWIAS